MTILASMQPSTERSGIGSTGLLLNLELEKYLSMASSVTGLNWSWGDFPLVPLIRARPLFFNTRKISEAYLGLSWSSTRWNSPRSVMKSIVSLPMGSFRTFLLSQSTSTFAFSAHCLSTSNFAREFH